MSLRKFTMAQFMDRFYPMFSYKATKCVLLERDNEHLTTLLLRARSDLAEAAESNEQRNSMKTDEPQGALQGERHNKHYSRIILELAAMLRIREPKDDGFINSDDIKPFIQNIRDAADALHKDAKSAQVPTPPASWDEKALEVAKAPACSPTGFLCMWVAPGKTEFSPEVEWEEFRRPDDMPEEWDEPPWKIVPLYDVIFARAALAETQGRPEKASEPNRNESLGAISQRIAMDIEKLGQIACEAFHYGRPIDTPWGSHPKIEASWERAAKAILLEAAQVCDDASDAAEALIQQYKDPIKQLATRGCLQQARMLEKHFRALAEPLEKK